MFSLKKKPVIDRIVYDKRTGKVCNVSNYCRVVEDLKKESGNRCSYCEHVYKNNITIDHIIPKKINRELINSFQNFALVCKTCNNNKDSINFVFNPYWVDSIYKEIYINSRGEIKVKTDSAHYESIKRFTDKILNTASLSERRKKYFHQLKFIASYQADLILKNNKLDDPQIDFPSALIYFILINGDEEKAQKIYYAYYERSIL